MPPVQGSEVPVAGRNIPPWRPGPGPPQDPVDHLPVIVPPAAAARRPVRTHRLQPDPLRISQIVTIEHRPGLPNPPAKIGETRPNRGPVPRPRSSAKSRTQLADSPIAVRSPGHGRPVDGPSRGPA